MKRVALLVAATILTVALLAEPASAANQGSDVLGQLFGGQPFPSDLGRYPLGNYMLDWDIDVQLDPLPVVKPKGAAADIISMLSNALWTLSLILAKLISNIFAWAWSVDFFTGPHGILRPISDAATVMYDDLFGREMLVAAIAVAGCWATVQMVRGRHGVGVAALAASFAYAILVVGIVGNMQGFITPVYQAVQGISSSVLSMRSDGAISPEKAERQANEHIHNAFIDGPYQLLQFGGLKHCVDMGDVNKDGYPRPVLFDEHTKGARVCRDNDRYARAFLDLPPDSDGRTGVITAIASGCQEKDVQLEDMTTYLTSCAKNHWDKADAPVVDMMYEGNAYIRLAIAAGVLIGTCFVFFLFGLIAVFVALAAVALAVLLAFAPAMAPLAFIPGRGHAIVQKWLSWVIGALFIKVVYSLLIGVLLTVNMALFAAAGAALPAGTAFFVNTAMFIGAVAFRKRITHTFLEARTTYDRKAVSTMKGVAVGAALYPAKTIAGRMLDRGTPTTVTPHQGNGSANGQAPAWTPPPYDHDGPRGGGNPPSPPPPVDAERIARAERGAAQTAAMHAEGAAKARNGHG